MPTVILENEFLLAVNKPAGLIVHSDGRTKEPSLAEWLLAQYPYLSGVGEVWVSPQGYGIARPGLVHRLDRTTSGIMIVVKTPEAYMYFKNEFKARRIAKTYRAIVYGAVEKERGVISAEIVRTSETPKRWYAIERPAAHKRTAITEYQALRDLPDATYLELKPKTGRTHQLRVHLAHIGHAIVADHLYAAGREPLFGFTRPALHACSLSLTLPSGINETYRVPLPADFENALAQ